MPDPAPVLLTVNGGSSSIKFAAYDGDRQLLKGEVERVGQPGTVLSAEGLGPIVKDQPLDAADPAAAADALIDWLQARLGDAAVRAIGHRIVHGGLRLLDHCRIDAGVLEQLRAAVVLDAAHLPREIALVEAFGKRFPNVPQVACFDTAFGRDLPAVARTLPVPRRYTDAGVRRFGFHGLSYAYLMGELKRLDPAAADGRVVLAHLGSGASLAAVHRGRPVDTSMSFTPLAGTVMGTRPGDLDAGFVTYLLRTERPSVDDLDHLLNHDCGLAGVSGTGSDMRDLQKRQATDPHAAEAVALFCYSARKWVGAFAAALGGLDTLVFAGGIGEHDAVVRAGICNELAFLGIELDAAANGANAAVVSKPGGRVTVRVMPTDEEAMIARITARLAA